MSNIIKKLTEAQQKAMENRPQVGGFPYLAEVLRQAGILKNIWHLPSCQSLYDMQEGCVVQQGIPLATGAHIIPPFNQDMLIQALRKDQAGLGSFHGFLSSAWQAGVISYVVDFD
jgi:uncharacterized protein YbcV (DUF1398 family)